MKRIVLCILLCTALVGTAAACSNGSTSTDDNTSAIVAEASLIRKDISSKESESKTENSKDSDKSKDENSKDSVESKDENSEDSVESKDENSEDSVESKDENSEDSVESKDENSEDSDESEDENSEDSDESQDENSEGSDESEDENSEDSDESEDENSEESREISPPEITGTAVDASWFDDAIFIGDSVTYGLYNYAENGCLGDADFLAIDCIGYHTAMFGLDHEYGIHPVYNGQKVMIDDAVQEIGKKKVFIMLGMNDICSWGVEESVDAMQEFVDQLLAKSPDIQIYVHSVTPMIAAKDGTRPDFLNNANIALYNEKIRPICAERGFVYLDLVPVVSDGNGNLRDDYCVDPGNLGFHYNRDGLQAWVDFLKTHVQ